MAPLKRTLPLYLSTVKILLQSVVSDNANFMTLDIKDFNLMTPLPRSEYIRIPLKFLSDTILAKHSLRPFILNNSVLFEVTKSMYGLPHAAKIAQDSLIARLATHGYLQTNTLVSLSPFQQRGCLYPRCRRLRRQVPRYSWRRRPHPLPTAALYTNN